MDIPEKLKSWDFPDTVTVDTGYSIENVPDLTRDNFLRLVEAYNVLVDYLQNPTEEH